MHNLNYSDLTALLAAIEMLHRDADPLTLPERTLQAVMFLIPNEITSFDGFGSDSHYNGYLWYSPPGTVSEEKVEILGELVHGHPMLQDLLGNQKNETARVSEFVSLSKFRETALYHEFYKHIGGDSQMATAFNVATNLFVTCSLHRLKSDFSDRDVAVLKALSPHLLAVFRNAQIFNNLAAQPSSISNALDTIGYGVLVLDAEFNVSQQNLTSIKMLHEYFPATGKLPEELLNYIKHCAGEYLSKEVFYPAAPLVVKKLDSKLRIRVSPDLKARSMVVFFEEIKQPSALILMKLGLTRREAEILLWIVKGKMDAEIAQIVYISLRTVHKHRENIYRKLGVETRTAASALVNEFLLQNSRSL